MSQLPKNLSQLVLCGPFMGVLTDVFLVLLFVLPSQHDSETYGPILTLPDGDC